MVTTRGRTFNGQSDLAHEPGYERQHGAKKKSRVQKADTTGDNVRGSIPNRIKARGQLLELTSNSLVPEERSAMMSMPIEIFAEICCYVEPSDLLQLSLISRRTRTVLMTRGAKHIWQTALSSVPGLPECPSDLNEPQFISLLYSSECSTKACTLRGSQLAWFHRLRLCKRCFNERMTNGAGIYEAFKNVRYRSWFPGLVESLDIGPTISSTRLQGLARQACSMNGKHFNVDEVHNAVEKYKTILQAPESRDNSDKYMNQLREQSGYRDKTGAVMLKWYQAELNARAEEAISRKNRRYESVKSHLIKAGWDPIDFPSLDDRDFRTLVYKDQQITAKIWQNIKPKLEPLIQRKRDIRLEREKQNRRRQRMQATASLYLRTAQNTVAISIRPWTLSLLIPEHRLIHASPPVKELLELDMETVTAEHWLDVADDVRLFVRRHWKVVQQNVLDIVEGRTALMHAEGAIQEDGDNESLAQDIEEITKKLASVTAAFVCKSGACRTVHWFPEMFDHLSSSCRGQVFNQILKLCEPFDEQRRQLVRRMVADIGLNADTATQADVRDLQNLICTRCHHDTARYSSFSMIASHYIQAQRWYAFVKQAKEMHSHPHQVNDDHDWTSNNAPLIRQYNGAERAFLESSQAVFQAQLSTEPKRICKLCPRDLGPLPCSTSMMEIHIRSKHGKEPEWDADTSRDTYFATYPCPT